MNFIHTVDIVFYIILEYYLKWATWWVLHSYCWKILRDHWSFGPRWYWPYQGVGWKENDKVGPKKVSMVVVLSTNAFYGVVHLTFGSSLFLVRYNVMVWKEGWTVWIRVIHHSSPSVAHGVSTCPKLRSSGGST